MALSSTEAEIIALVSATQEAIWIRGIIEWLQPNTLEGPTQIEQDNSSAIYLVNRKTLTKNSRHYGKDYFFVTEHVENKDIDLVKQDTEVIASDVFTKPLARLDYYRHIPKFMSRRYGQTLNKSSEDTIKQSSFYAKGVCEKLLWRSQRYM